jgi:hypothetical protein
MLPSNNDKLSEIMKRGCLSPFFLDCRLTIHHQTQIPSHMECQGTQPNHIKHKHRQHIKQKNGVQKNAVQSIISLI